MVVHADDTRHNRIASQVEYRGAIARGLIRACRYRCYLSALDVDVLIGDRRGSRSINDLDVLKAYSGGANAHIFARLRAYSIYALGVDNPGARQGRQADQNKP